MTQGHRVTGYISHDKLQKIFQYDVLFLRPPNQGKKYEYFNKRSVNRLGYIFGELEVGGKYIRKAKILVARRGAKSIGAGLSQLFAVCH